ncbi:signal recognition particle protein [candidate division KSB1 bacterium]|nr:MAG: signal recognition particle protein [candidate division KSB1 bacterium]
MFEELIEKLDTSIRNIRGIGKITEKNISEPLRMMRRALLEADVNYKVAKDFIQAVKEKALGTEVAPKVSPGQQLVKIVYDELTGLLGGTNSPLREGNIPPSVIMVVGLQGSGKTTFAGKLGFYLKKRGKNPLLASVDIYRPAALKQLEITGKSSGIPVYTEESDDAVEIAKRAVEKARKESFDTLILDTAGRLHVDNEMMEELKKLKDVLKPAEILFVADSMTGQDAVKSAEAFLEQVDFTGVVLSKMDGDSRGGAALSVKSVTGKQIKFVSNGEKPQDLEPFYPERMASRILGMGDIVTFVEKAQEAVDLKKSERLAKKLKRNRFTLEDFYDQLAQVKKMGPIDQLLGMIPGAGKQIKGMQVDEKAFVQIEAIINSMTIEERQNPSIIGGSRRKRIAAGSGTTVQDVNRLLKQFKMMQKMVKQMSRYRSNMIPGGIPM